jgi:hypothetical protein
LVGRGTFLAIAYWMRPPRNLPGWNYYIPLAKLFIVVSAALGKE